MARRRRRWRRFRRSWRRTSPVPADVRWLPTGTANAGTPSRGPMSRCSKLGVSAAALSATALREVAGKCRLPNSQGELLTLARRYERRADYLLSKYAADDRG